MKELILTITTILILSFNLNAQSIQTGNSFITNDLSSLISKNNKNPEVWPWNGCKEFTISVKLKVVEVEFITLICCTQGVCVPYNTKKSPFAGQKQITITSSSKVHFDEYIISVASGTYNIDSQGRPMNLNYHVKKK